MQASTSDSSCNSLPADTSTPQAAVDRMVEVAVVALWRRTLSGRCELLVARRHAEAIRGGLWELPGGKVENGETAEAAALREAEEEVGIARSAMVGAPTPLAVSAHSDPSLLRERSVRLHAFLVEVKQGVEASPLGASEVRWIDPAAMDDFEWPPANRSLNTAIQNALR
jgi:8-oxo-dGTP diphosphatase